MHTCIHSSIHPSIHDMQDMTLRWLTLRWIESWSDCHVIYIHIHPGSLFAGGELGGWDRDDNVPWTCTHPRCYAVRPNRKNPFLAAADIIPKDALVPGSLSWLEWQQNVSATLEEGSQDFLAALGDVGLSFLGVQGQGIARWRTTIV